jgi:hypothetical protein
VFIVIYVYANRMWVTVLYVALLFCIPVSLFCIPVSLFRLPNLFVLCLFVMFKIGILCCCHSFYGSFILCMVCFLSCVFCVFVLLCVLFLPMYVAVSFLFVYSLWTTATG